MRFRIRNTEARRRESYPAVGDQLDALWKAVEQLLGERTINDAQAQAVRERIQEIKRSYPKR